jgi:hypothetical protein
MTGRQELWDRIIIEGDVRYFIYILAIPVHKSHTALNEADLIEGVCAELGFKTLMPSQEVKVLRRSTRLTSMKIGRDCCTHLVITHFRGVLRVRYFSYRVHL